MASAQSRSSGSGPARRAGTDAPVDVPVRRRLLPITIFLAALIGLVALGATVFARYVIWSTPETPTREVNPTAEAFRREGLIAEKDGKPRRIGDQIYVPVKVTNNYRASVAPPGTPTPGIPTPEPTDVHVEVATIVVFFYGNQTGTGLRPIVGRADGQVLDLAHGQSKTVEVLGIGIPADWNDENWEPQITSVVPRVPDR